MSVSSFIVGLMLIGLGFLMVWRRRNFHEYFGDLGSLFDMPESSWLTWEVIGSVLMIIGFLVAMGVFQAFMTKLLGQILIPTINQS